MAYCDMYRCVDKPVDTCSLYKEIAVRVMEVFANLPRDAVHVMH